MFLKIKTVTTTLLTTMSFIYLLIYFCFFYRFSFNFELEIKDQYCLIFLLHAFAFALLLLLFSKDRISLLQMICLFTVVVLCLLLTTTNYYSFSNEHFFNICTVFFMGSMFVFFKSEALVITIFILCLIVYLLQLIIGYWQLFNNIHQIDKLTLLIRGSFGNSGIYASYLVVHIPILFFLFFRWNCFEDTVLFSSNFLRLTFFKKWIFATLFGATLFIIYKTQSRTALIALSFSVAGLLITAYKPLIRSKLMGLSKMKLLLISIFLLLGIIFFSKYLYNLKRLSTVGRVLRTQITINHISEDFWFGTGLGRFTWYYPQWQAEYFRTHNNPPQEFYLSAGESYLVFNEYLQLIKEIGIIGFLMFLFFLLFLFNSRSESKKHLINTVNLTSFIILSCGFTSYSFHVNFFLLMLGFCIAVGITFREGGNTSLTKICEKIVVPKKVIIIPLFLVLFTACIGVKKINAVKKWEEVIEKEYIVENNESYLNIYNVLHMDGKFLNEYGRFLLEDKQYKDAIKVLEESRKYFISSESMYNISQAYTEYGAYSQAISYNKWICYYLPNRFLPKYRLLKLYQITNDTLKIKETALTIQNMQVKISSSEVEKIKAEAKVILETY